MTPGKAKYWQTINSRDAQIHQTKSKRGLTEIWLSNKEYGKRNKRWSRLQSFFFFFFFFFYKINTLSVVILWLPTFWSSKILWPPYFSFQKFMTPSIFGTPFRRKCQPPYIGQFQHMINFILGSDISIFVPVNWWYTRGNYATRDSSGMCHLMPQRHLLEWREEDEQAFVHHGIWISNKGLDNTMPAIVNCIYMEVTINWQTTPWKALWQTLKSMVWTWTATMYKCLLIFPSPLWQMLPWHQVAHATAILSDIQSFSIGAKMPDDYEWFWKMD